MATAQIIVAPLNAEDTVAVRNLLVSGLTERWGTYEPGFNPDIESLPRCYEGAFVLVAKKAGVVVGTGTLRPVGPGQAEVVRMSVSSSSRCAGTGSLILLQLLQRAREQSMQEVRLETTSSWLSAVSFYTCLGFVKTHEQGDDSYFVYKPGEA